MEIFKENGYAIARIRIKESDNNYNYVVWCIETSECAVIDPLDQRTLLDFIRQHNLSVRYIINTHAHPDHIEGNDAILKVTTSKILIHPKGASFVSPRCEMIDDGDRINIGRIDIRVIYTPGHCTEHVSLILGDNIFVGDTLFLSGCGNTRFRGDVNELYDSIAFKLKTLPDNVKVFCGHDYAEKNLKFALSIEPNNEYAKAKLEEVKSEYSRNKEPQPSTIGEEKRYNPFLRFEVPDVVEEVKKRKSLSAGEPVLIFKAIRELRDTW